MSFEVPPPLCQDCGACCTGEGDHYVPVTGNDHERLGARAGALTHFDGIHCYMRMKNGHCVALEVDAASGRFACTVYDRRPSICRDLERGSQACDAERERKPDPLSAEATRGRRSPKP